MPWETEDGCLHVYPLPEMRSAYSFRLMVLYTKKAPQLPAQELVVFAKKMAAAASRCCPLRDELQSACVEDQVSTLVTHLPSWEPTSFLGHIYDLPVEFKILRGGYFQVSPAICLRSCRGGLSPLKLVLGLHPLGHIQRVLKLTKLMLVSSFKDSEDV